MNEIQYDRKKLVNAMAARVRRLENELAEARTELQYRRRQLQIAIDVDPQAWHDTPGILK